MYAYLLCYLPIPNSEKCSWSKYNDVLYYQEHGSINFLLNYFHTNIAMLPHIALQKVTKLATANDLNPCKTLLCALLSYSIGILKGYLLLFLFSYFCNIYPNKNVNFKYFIILLNLRKWLKYFKTFCTYIKFFQWRDTNNFLG